MHRSSKCPMLTCSSCSTSKSTTVPFFQRQFRRNTFAHFDFEFASNVKRGQLTFLSWFGSRYDSPDHLQTFHKKEWGLKNALAINSPLLAATGNEAEGAMSREEDRWGQNEDRFCSLTISVEHGGAAGVERGSALQISLILPLLLFLVRRLMHCFDLVLQHGKTTDGHTTRAEGTRHLDESRREKAQMSWNARYERDEIRPICLSTEKLILCICWTFSLMDIKTHLSNIKIRLHTSYTLKKTLVIDPDLQTTKHWQHSTYSFWFYHIAHND